ncbi:MAG: M42 family metallopeptidase [Oscillospiraceae bacterium]
MELIDYLKDLCTLDGISGDEGAVAEYICKAIDGKCEYKIDNLGNIIAFCKGKKPALKKTLISAHMDEVGLIVTYVNPDGTLNFSTVGGIDPRVLFGRRVYVGKNKHLGVIAGKAIHNLSSDERSKAPSAEAMTIDIGAADREDALKRIRPGDSVVFDSQFLRFGNDRIKCKAIDDRAGCAIMLKIIEDQPEYDTIFTFVVQEEVGLRGATAASFTAAPEIAIIIEATTASDIPSSAGEKRVCELGKGPVVSFMDRHTIYDKELYHMAFETAGQLGIPCQTKTLVAGGNDAGAFSVSRGGVRTAAVSLPCRYLHSPSCVIDHEDMVNSYKLIKKLLERIQEQ